ncbi:MAG: hypothetical protein HQL66_07185 [Magnetococcales bacterium]|nr:hypothetical protein [Magnetococcales bacterium]
MPAWSTSTRASGEFGAAHHRALAALVGGMILLGWLLLIRLIAGSNYPGAEGLARFALVAVTVLGPAAAWLLYRLIRHRDPQDDIDHPGWPELALVWLLERYERIFPRQAVYADRPRTRSYVSAANRGFHGFLAEAIVELERKPVDTDSTTPVIDNPDRPRFDANANDDAAAFSVVTDIAGRAPGVTDIASAVFESPPDVDTGAASSEPVSESLSPVSRRSRRDSLVAEFEEAVAPMRLRRRRVTIQTPVDAQAMPPDREETET